MRSEIKDLIPRTGFNSLQLTSLSLMWRVFSLIYPVLDILFFRLRAGEHSNFRTDFPKKQVILLACHFLDKRILSKYKRIKRSCQLKFDVYMLYDNSRKDFDDTGIDNYFLTDHKVSTRLGYKPFGNEMHRNSDHSVIEFFKKKPEYDNYWRVEYDVDFMGPWGLFFSSFDDNSADYLGTYLGEYSNAPDWLHWGKIEPAFPQQMKRGSFFPVNRFSNKALRVLDEKYSKGITGYCEVVVPTVLFHEGCNIGEIGRKWYSPKTFNCRTDILRKRMKLIHPDFTLRTSFILLIKNIWHKLGFK